ncbi:MAG: hypothetical protein ABIQ52_16730 [Vicinamibacterales bacterium]
MSRGLHASTRILLLGVHRDGRLVPPLGGPHALRNLAKLRVAVGLLPPFALNIPLQVLAQREQQLRDQGLAHSVLGATDKVRVVISQLFPDQSISLTCIR